ncbi:MAG: LamG-like jellyroll fold domain-containing protein [Phycisphaeraceae bacterium]
MFGKNKFMACTAVALAVAGWGTSRAQASAYNDAVLASNPLYYWTFDEASGNAIEQVAANAQDQLAPSGNATRIAGTTNNGGVSLGTAASFSGPQNTPGGVFSLTDLSGSGSLSKYAIEFWVKADSGFSQEYVMDVGGNNTPAVLFNYTANVLAFYSPDTGGTDKGPVISPDTWYHVVMGTDQAAAQTTIIVDDGTPVVYSYSGTTYGLGQGQVTVGGYAVATNNFFGAVDELALYDLTSGDFNSQLANIAAHYSAGPIPEPASLALIGAGGLLLLRRRQR